MCLYVGSDVVLANLLNYSINSENGIVFSDIERYCEKIKIEINSLNKETKFISFQVYDRSIEDVINLYPTHFKEINRRYYKGLDFDIDEFSWKLSPEFRMLFENSAKKINFKIVEDTTV